MNHNTNYAELIEGKDLTEREVQLFRLCQEGEIETISLMMTLGIAEQTLKNHTRSMLQKTGFFTRADIRIKYLESVNMVSTLESLSSLNVQLAEKIEEIESAIAKTYGITLDALLEESKRNDIWDNELAEEIDDDESISAREARAERAHEYAMLHGIDDSYDAIINGRDDDVPFYNRRDSDDDPFYLDDDNIAEW